MAVSNAYEMETTDDLYTKVQKKIEPVPSRHAVQANDNEIYFVAQDVLADECEYDQINRNADIPTSGASTSPNIATESTKGEKDKKCNLTNSAFMLAFLSLLVAIVAVSLVYVFSIKPNNEMQNPVATSQSQKRFTQKISNITITLEQQIAHVMDITNQQMDNITAIFGEQIANITTSFERQIAIAAGVEQQLTNVTTIANQQMENITEIFREQIANITTSLERQAAIVTRVEQKIANISRELKQERNQTLMDLKRLKSNITHIIQQDIETVAMMEQQTNKLNVTLLTVQENTVDIQRKQQTTNQELQAANGQLQELQNLINLFILNHSDTEWLTLLNGFQYRRTNQTMNWDNTWRECQRLGGDLASVRMSKASTRTFLLSHFLTKDNSYWIGLKDRRDDDWYWINDNEQINNSSDIWFEGEPNNSGQGEDCAVLAVKMSVVKANDANCGWSFYGLCEKSIVS